jgi:hypothetical protein
MPGEMRQPIRNVPLPGLAWPRRRLTVVSRGVNVEWLYASLSGKSLGPEAPQELGRRAQRRGPSPRRRLKQCRSFHR